MDDEREPAWVVTSRLVSLIIGAFLLFIVGLVWWAGANNESWIARDYSLGFDILSMVLAAATFVLAAVWNPRTRPWAQFASAGCAFALTGIFIAAVGSSPWWVFFPATVIAINASLAWFLVHKGRLPHHL